MCLFFKKTEGQIKTIFCGNSQHATNVDIEKNIITLKYSFKPVVLKPLSKTIFEGPYFFQHPSRLF